MKTTQRNFAAVLVAVTAGSISLTAVADSDSDYATHKDVQDVYGYVDQHINDTNANVQRVETSAEEDNAETNKRVDVEQQRNDQQDETLKDHDQRIANNTSEIDRNFNEHERFATGIKEAKDSAGRAQNTADRALSEADSNQNDIDKIQRDVSHVKNDVSSNKTAIQKESQASKDRSSNLQAQITENKKQSQDRDAKNEEFSRQQTKDISRLNARADGTDQTLKAQDGRVTGLENSQAEQDKKISANTQGVSENKAAVEKAQTDANNAGTTADRALNLGNLNQNAIDDVERKTNHNTNDIAVNRQATAKAQSVADSAYDYAGDAYRKASVADLNATTANGKADINGQSIDTLRQTSDNHEERITTLEGQQKDHDGRITANANGLKDNRDATAKAQSDATDAGKVADRADDQSLKNRNDIAVQGQTLKNQDQRITANASGLKDNRVATGKAQQTADGAAQSALIANGKADGLKPRVDAHDTRLDVLDEGQKTQDQKIAGNTAAAASAQSSADTANAGVSTLDGRVTEQGGQIATLGERTNGQDVRLDGIDASQKVQDQRLNSIDEGQKVQDQRLAANEKGLTGVNGKVTGLTGRVDAQGNQISANTASVATAQADADRANTHLKGVDATLQGHDEALQDHDARLKGLKSGQDAQGVQINENRELAEQANFNSETAIDNSVQASTDASYAKVQADSAKVTSNQASTDAKGARLVAGEALKGSDAAQVSAANANLKAQDANKRSTAAYAQSTINAQDIATLNRDVVTTNKRIDRGNAETLGKANAYTDARVGAVDKKVDSVRKEARQGIASVAALASIPNVPGKDLSIGVGVGHFSGESAVSVGGAYHEQGSNWAAKAGIGFTESEYTIGAGVSFGF